MSSKRTMLPYLAMTAAGFFTVPIVVNGTLMLFIIILVCFLSAFFFGLNNPPDLWYVPIVAVMFAISSLIYYPHASLVYTVSFALITLLGNGMGYGYQKLRDRDKK